jgi:hypothetical protein
MKILEYIESAQDNSGNADLPARLALPEYKQILEQSVICGGGWRAVARAWPRRELAIDIEARWSDAGDAARIIDFSYRFAQFKKGDKRLGGVTLARKFVCATGGVRDRTMKTRWREYGDTAILRYVLGRIGPRPAKINKKQFVQKLLAQVADVNRLRKLFAAYRDVSRVLRRRGYRGDDIVVDCLSRIRADLGLKDCSSQELKVINGNDS